MRFCIVSPPTVTEFGKELAESEAILKLSEHAPIGILTLAAVLEEQGFDFDLIDLNVLFYTYISLDDSSLSFKDYATRQILSKEFDAIGFGTICSTYPLTLRLVEAVKEARPDCVTMLGGPQASAVDVATLESFGAVDFVLRYEAEHSLPALLRVLSDGGDVASVAGVTYRLNGAAVRTPSPPVIEDLDSIPLPAFHRYPYIEKASYIPLELGRGCPYACTFCSTNDFFRRRFRLKSPRKVVEEMRLLKDRYGISHFDLIHDMFTVDRDKVLDFCREIRLSGEVFYWNCSARTDRVDQELLSAMYEAGCRGIFFGIETGSQALQPIIKKNLVLEDAMKSVRTASDLGINAAVSLITGFPDETPDDFAGTVDFFVRALRHENTIPQLHILAPLADTPLHRRFQDKLIFDDIISDMSHQGWDQETVDRELITSHPNVFPNFYAVPTPLDREYLKRARAFLLYGAPRFGWLLPALHRDSGHILKIYETFATTHGDPEVAYYRTEAFRNDFVAFLRESYLPVSRNGRALSAALSYFETFSDLAVDDPTEDLPLDKSRENGQTIYRPALELEAVPHLPDNVRLLDCDVDFLQMRRLITEGEALDGITPAATKLASRKLPGRWPEILQLSQRSIDLLAECDGKTSVSAIIERMQARTSEIAGLQTQKAVRIGLELLRHDGLLN